MRCVRCVRCLRCVRRGALPAVRPPRRGRTTCRRPDAEVARTAAGGPPTRHIMRPRRTRAAGHGTRGDERRTVSPLAEVAQPAAGQPPTSHERPPAARPRGTSCDLDGPERQVVGPGATSAGPSPHSPKSHNPPPGHRRGHTNGRRPPAQPAHRATSTDTSGTSCDLGRSRRGRSSDGCLRRRQASGSSGASAAGFGASSWVATTRGDSDMKRRTSRSTMMSAGRSGRVRYSPSRDVSRDSAT